MKIGILHPGEMGVTLAASGRNSGHEVLWLSAGRSEATRGRAASLGLGEVAALEDFCAACEVIVSVCPPHAAAEQARAVREAGFRGIYADANAVAPATVAAIGGEMTAAGIAFVDGGIIGLPPRERGTTWLYLSGERASVVAECFAAGPMETEVLDERIGSASALKMCFAANTKGTTALQTAVLGAAEALGVRAALERQWDRYNPGISAKTATRIRGVARKAWRFTGEMEEIAATLEAAGMPGDFHRGAREIYARQAQFKDCGEPPAMEDILKALGKDG